MALRASLAELR